MKLRFITLIVALVATVNSWAFERVGHDAVAYIAECNLTPKAKAAIERYLGGKSIVYYSSWMDYTRLTPEYKFSDGWHSASVDSIGKAKLWKSRYYGQVGINEMWKQLSNRKQMSDSAVAVAIKLMVHMVGDIHCPAHNFIEGISQNRYFYLNDSVRYKFHKFFDGDLFSLTHKWYYPQYQEQLDRCTKAEKKAIVQGTLVDWIEDNGRIVRPIYDILTPERSFNTAETHALLNQLGELQDNQVRNAGYRLAHVLNSLFDPTYAPKWKPE